MEANEFFFELDKKKEELDKRKPLSKDIQLRLDKKYRLEWNYNSNHIEGNTLTYGQTELLLFFGKTTGEKEKREWDEMQAHDAAITLIQAYATDSSRQLTEVDVRELNKIILVRPFWKEAITPDGQPTRKLVEPGKYKQTPNSVRLQNGEIHHYASPEETPIQMRELTDWLIASKSLHPVMEAIIFHHRFTQIHPFDDGNGRVARLIVNFILLRKGYPPLVIRSINKKEYLTALQIADTGDMAPLIKFISYELNWSLDLSTKAAMGESIEEAVDIDKKIELLKKQLSQEDISTKKLSSETGTAVFKKSIIPLLKIFEEKCSQLMTLFNAFDRHITGNISGRNLQLATTNTDWTEVEKAWDHALVSTPNNNPSSLEYTYQFRGNKKSLEIQYISTTLNVDFREYSYSIRINSDLETSKSYSYDSPLNNDELDSIVSGMIEPILNQLSSASRHKKGK